MVVELDDEGLRGVNGLDFLCWRRSIYVDRVSIDSMNRMPCKNSIDCVLSSSM